MTGAELAKPMPVRTRRCGGSAHSSARTPPCVTPVRIRKVRSELSLRRPRLGPNVASSRSLRRRLRQKPKLGQHRCLIEKEVDLGKLAALELRNHGDRQANGLVRGGNYLAPGHLQRSRVGSSDVAQLGNPIPGTELRFHRQPNVGKRLEKRVERRPDRLHSLDPLRILWIPLDDRIQVEALELIEVALV